MKKLVKCDWCGKEIFKYPSHVKKHNFCCRKCLSDFSNKSKNPKGWGAQSYVKASIRMTKMNKELNAVRMTSEVREKLRRSKLGTGKGKSYAKIYSRHEHRVVAEHILGRKLLPGEVVHHIDRNKRNNSPENLMIFSSQKEHALWHKTHDKGGDAE